MLLELKTTRSNWCDILGLVVRDGSGIQEGLGFQDGQWNHQEAIVNLVGCKTLCVICVSGEEMSRSGGSARSGGQRARSISLGTWCSFTLFLASSSNSLLVFVMWSFCFLFFFFLPCTSWVCRNEHTILSLSGSFFESGFCLRILKCCPVWAAMLKVIGNMRVRV